VCVKPQKPISVLFSLLGLRGKFFIFLPFLSARPLVPAVLAAPTKKGIGPPPQHASMVLNDAVSGDKYMNVRMDVYTSP
jgi:hypothetical protein